MGIGRGGGLKSHPCVGVWRDASATFVALMKALGLTASGWRITQARGTGLEAACNEEAP